MVIVQEPVDQAIGLLAVDQDVLRNRSCPLITAASLLSQEMHLRS